MDIENKPERSSPISDKIGSLLLRLVNKLLIPPPIDTAPGHTFSTDERNCLTLAYMNAFKDWNDPSYKLPTEETLELKREYLENWAFTPDSLITTMEKGSNICAFAITGITPKDPTNIAEDFANGIKHIYPELSQISTLLEDSREKILPAPAIPFKDLAIIRNQLSSHIPPYVPKPVERLLRAHISTKFLAQHLQELLKLGNEPSTTLVFWTAGVSPLLQIARQRPDSFTQQALFTPKGGEGSEENPKIYIFTTTIDRLLAMIENPFTYRRAISSETQVPLFTYQYEPS